MPSIGPMTSPTPRERIEALLGDVERFRPAPAVGVLRAYVDEFTAPDEYDDQEGAVAEWMTDATRFIARLAAAVREMARDSERLDWLAYDMDEGATVPPPAGEEGESDPRFAWLTARVQEGIGSIEFGQNEDGYVGVFLAGVDAPLGIGETATEAIDDAISKRQRHARKTPAPEKQCSFTTAGTASPRMWWECKLEANHVGPHELRIASPNAAPAPDVGRERVERHEVIQKDGKVRYADNKPFHHTCTPESWDRFDPDNAPHTYRHLVELHEGEEIVATSHLHWLREAEFTARQRVAAAEGERAHIGRYVEDRIAQMDLWRDRYAQMALRADKAEKELSTLRAEQAKGVEGIVAVDSHRQLTGQEDSRWVSLHNALPVGSLVTVRTKEGTPWRTPAGPDGFVANDTERD